MPWKITIDNRNILLGVQFQQDRPSGRGDVFRLPMTGLQQGVGQPFWWSTLNWYCYYSTDSYEI